MIILRMYVEELSSVLQAGYDEIVVYRDLAGGTFDTEVGTVGIRLGTNTYEFEDPDGTLDSWYEVSYRVSSDHLQESPKSLPFQGISAVGPLGLVTIPYIRANTDFPAIANMDDSKLAEYIWRAEALIESYASQYGGLCLDKPNADTMMAIAERLIIEGLYISGNPATRARRANGLQSEKIGSYSYSVAKDPTGSTSSSYLNPYSALGPEAQMILNYYTCGTAVGTVHMHTTQVFPEILPIPGDPLTPEIVGVTVRPWHDFTDVQLRRGLAPMYIQVGR